MHNIGAGEIEAVTKENTVSLVVVGVALIVILGIGGFLVALASMAIYSLDTTHFGFEGVTRWIIAGSIQGFLVYGVFALFEYTGLEKFRSLFFTFGGLGILKVSYWLAFKLFPAKKKISDSPPIVTK